MLAYSLWGLLPIYWKWLQHVPALQLLAHRILWSFVALALVLVVRREPGALREAARGRGPALLAAVMIGVNWLVYIWAVNAGYIVETSLGYFINPLLNVLLGVLCFRERLRPEQWAALGLATAGVGALTLAYGRLPWIALTLAGTFAGYGIVKKRTCAGPVAGLTLETALLLPLALAWLAWCAAVPSASAAVPVDPRTLALLAGGGVVTTIPLLLFAHAAPQIPLSLIGLLQYLAPTLQFLLGVLVYREPFSRSQAIGFGLVWAGLLLFAAESWMSRTTKPH